jgi:DNA-binding winged helix-turn-helix (wHTH) protein
MEDDTYRFGEFSMSPRERRLFRNGESVLLPPKAFDAMYLLVQTCRGPRRAGTDVQGQTEQSPLRR